MVTWPKYGLTVPLEVWELRQARENSLDSARQHFDRTQLAPFNAVQPKSALTLSAQAGMPRGNPKSAAEYVAYAASVPAKPKSAQTKFSHWQAVAKPANRSVPASTAKARGLAAMNSQMQAFVPGSSAANHRPVQHHAPENSHNTVIEHFDLAADDNSSVSSWSLAQ